MQCGSIEFVRIYKRIVQLCPFLPQLPAAMDYIPIRYKLLDAAFAGLS
jgi:hypothetical protein